MCLRFVLRDAENLNPRMFLGILFVENSYEVCFGEWLKMGYTTALLQLSNNE